MASNLTTIASTILITCATYCIWKVFHNYFLHPLAKFPGPVPAAITSWYKTWQELFTGRSWIDVLSNLHSRYGDIIRVTPNELHFSNPEAYMDIYNNNNRWDKEASLYRCFGEDHSSFGYLTYTESKKRKDVMAPLFSKRAILEIQTLIERNVNKLCNALAANHTEGKSSDMLFGLRCFTLDTITQFCFAKDVAALEAPDFQAPIVIAMDAALEPFAVFKNFDAIRRIVFSLPGWLTKITTPPLAGLIDLQTILGAQVKEVAHNPTTLRDTPHPIVYHRLLDPEVNKGASIPSEDSLYEEAQALLFGGADSAANTTMVGTFHVLQNPALYQRLKGELQNAWPALDNVPRYEDLEKLPYLTAVIQESLRMAPGVPAPLLRVVPEAGAKISGRDVPGGTVLRSRPPSKVTRISQQLTFDQVGMSMQFVHRSEKIFSDPDNFDPDRWLQPKSIGLERLIVTFSRGPRSCLGQNLAMCELYLAFAHLFRRFDLELDGSKAGDLAWTERFLPLFTGRHIRAVCKPSQT